MVNSYLSNKDQRPYLFLAEVFYYALENRHNKQAIYRVLQKTKEKANQLTPWSAWGDLLDEALLLENLSPRFIEVVQKMTKSEVEIFLKIAELAIIDEDEEYYLYAPVTDEEIQLYKHFGISNSDFLTLEEAGLINIGARIDNIMEVRAEDYCGFQNDQLVLAFILKEGHKETIELHYKSYSFTSVGLKLLDILSLETSEEFFKQLAHIFKEQLRNMEQIKVELFRVEDIV